MKVKKKLTIVTGVIIAAGVLVVGLFHSGTAQMGPSLTKADVKNLVSKQYPGEIKEPVLKTEANRPVYEVEISTNEKDYDLKLDGHSGDTLNIKATNKNTAQAKQHHKKDNNGNKENKKNKENKENKKNNEKHNNQAKEKEQNKQAEEQKETKTVISTEEAAKIALQQFSGEVDEIELEEEDGRLIYEVEIERGEQEAEVEIDAYTGEVIVIEIEED